MTPANGSLCTSGGNSLRAGIFRDLTGNREMSHDQTYVHDMFVNQGRGKHRLAFDQFAAPDAAVERGRRSPGRAQPMPPAREVQHVALSLPGSLHARILGGAVEEPAEPGRGG